MFPPRSPRSNRSRPAISSFLGDVPRPAPERFRPRRRVSGERRLRGRFPSGVPARGGPDAASPASVSEAAARRLGRCAARAGAPPDARALFAEVSDGARALPAATLLDRLGVAHPRDRPGLIDALGGPRGTPVDAKRFAAFVRLGPRHVRSERDDDNSDDSAADDDDDGGDDAFEVVLQELARMGEAPSCDRPTTAAGPRRRRRRGTRATTTRGRVVRAADVSRVLERGGWGDLFENDITAARSVVDAADYDEDGALDASELAAFAERGGASVAAERRAIASLRRGVADFLDAPRWRDRLDAASRKTPADRDAAFRNARRDLDVLKLVPRRDRDLAALQFSREGRSLVTVFGLAKAFAFAKTDASRDGGPAANWAGALKTHAGFFQVAAAANAGPNLRGKDAAATLAALKDRGLAPSLLAALDLPLRALRRRAGAAVDAVAAADPLARRRRRRRRRDDDDDDDADFAPAPGDAVFYRAEPGEVVRARQNGRVDVALPGGRVVVVRASDLEPRDASPPAPAPPEPAFSAVVADRYREPLPRGPPPWESAARKKPPRRAAAPRRAWQ